MFGIPISLSNLLFPGCFVYTQGNTFGHIFCSKASHVVFEVTVGNITVDWVLLFVLNSIFQKSIILPILFSLHTDILRQFPMPTW